MDEDPVQYFFMFFLLYVLLRDPSKMSVVELNPVDGLPEFKGRKVVSDRQKLRAEKRAHRFVMVGWGELAAACQAVDADRAVRLLMVLYLHRKLSRSRDGWTLPEQKDLAALGIADRNLGRDVAKLEALGLVEVKRRPGKRPLLRLVGGQER
jgi:DNA-binding transcriptional ArsR family regulator